MPPAVVTATFPVPPIPTVAVIFVSELIINELACIPPKLIAVAPLKFVPVIFTIVPDPPVVGVNPVTMGAGINVNPACDAFPKGVVTFMLPDAPGPTTAVMVVALTTVKEVAATPPKLTAEAPVKLVPVIVTVLAAPALVGVKSVIAGGAANTNPDLEPEPNGVVTTTSPDAPDPTVTIKVVEFTKPTEAAARPQR